MGDTQNNKKPNVPNLRFPGFSGEWNSCELGDIAELSKGAGISKDQRSSDGNPCILYGELYTTYLTEIIDEVVSKTNLDPKGLVKSKANDIIIPASGETAIDISTARCVLHDDVLLGGDLNIIRLNEQDGKFFSYQLNGVRKKDIARIAHGVSIVHLHGNALSHIVVNYPSRHEQDKISSLLSLIDQRIAIQNKVIEKYESLIKALRHNIFSTLAPEKEVTIADVLSYEQPTTYIVSDTEYSDNKDLTPVLTANKAFILGYTEEAEGIYDKGPCIILDDFTLDSKIVDFPFKVKSSAIKILSAKTTVRLRYIYEYLKFLDLNTEEHKRHYIAEIEPMTIELPDEDTIRFIACLFDRVDQRRKGLERSLQLLKYQKDYLLRALFI